MTPDSSLAPYAILGDGADRAVTLSVPHAGRHYPPALLEQARVPLEALVKLEDRYADRLIAPVAALGFTTLVATYTRAWIDLNRDPGDIDLAMVKSLPRSGMPSSLPSEKMRGGLGLFPRRLAHYGDLWRGRFHWDDLTQRIARVHKPYHEAIAAMLRERHRRHGFALLLDVHSMPSLPGDAPAQLVVGDRHGATAPDWLIQRIEQEARLSGMTVKRNQPYAGGYVIERHGKPRQRQFAIQVEIDRACYLDAAGDPRADACAALGAVLARMALAAEMAMVDRFSTPYWLEAAE